ncbi:Panacea domain-containing protein [Glaesserella parasuis]|uniref:Panacea domain-containing protein n=1 Tax=Glaesserella parasuis TaxID=738 RepID=UPI00243680CA|nr:Panacea domain-containing protein [Glaesserella parasuis]MDG6333998.1 Panacea domain-containing protein [Glaesserella parasuis]
MFNELKTAQAGAYLLHKAGGTMHHIKLMKLLYLSDRLSWLERDHSITGDEYYSLPYGPVLSKTLNLIRGETLNHTKTAWEEWISDKENHQVSIAKIVDEKDEYFWGELSLSDTDILDSVFEKYGHFDRFALVELTHNPDIVPEWEDPKGGAKKITLEKLLQHLGKSKAQIKAIFEEQAEMQQINRLFKGTI